MEGLKYEADPRHGELLGRALGLEACKPYSTPGTKHPEDLDHGPTNHETIMIDAVEDALVNTIRPLSLAHGPHAEGEYDHRQWR